MIGRPHRTNVQRRVVGVWACARRSRGDALAVDRPSACRVRPRNPNRVAHGDGSGARSAVGCESGRARQIDAPTRRRLPCRRSIVIRKGRPGPGGRISGSTAWFSPATRP